MKTESGKKGMTLCMLLVVMFVFQEFANAGTINLPHKYPRTNPNLLSNPTFNGSAGWTLNPSTEYQSSGGHTADGSGCIKFLAGQCSWSHQVKSETFYNFEYDTPYTISFYVKTQHEPVYLNACLHMYDANEERTYSYSTGFVATSTTGEWQEAVCVVKITDYNIVKFKVVIEERESAAYTSDFFIDDVYFGKGISFDQPPVNSKETFSGSKVTIDELGNWQVYENEQWKDFFPFGLYVNWDHRENFNSLSTQGFNTVLSLQVTEHLQWAQDAVSSFNPNGMRAGWRLQQYAKPDDYWTMELLANKINYIASNWSDTLLCYDWDNENNWTNWSCWFDMVNTIRNSDANHPVYVLNGYCGVQRLFSKRLSDVCGTYVHSAGGTMETGGFKFDVLQYLTKQNIPASAAQLNGVEQTAYGMRMRVYYALIQGAKAIFWWGDGLTDGPADEDETLLAENRPWWSDIPNLRNEIDSMLPILKQPNWTSWSVNCSDAEILCNTRDGQNEGYMIVMNPAASPSLVTFTLSGYTATEAWNYFDNSFIAPVSNNQLKVLLPAHSTAVYRLVNVNYPELLLNGGMENSGSPIANWGQKISGTATRDIEEKYNGDASCKIVNNSLTQDTYLSQGFSALKPNTVYRFSVMVKMDNVVRDETSDYNGVLVQLYAGSNLFFPLPGKAGSSDGWELIEKTFTTPENGTNWYVRLRLTKATGCVWFDNASLVELNHNFILNGGMEAAGEPLTNWTMSGDGCVIRDIGTKFFGDASCKITNQTPTDDSRLVQNYAALKPATTYYFSARMKTDNVVKANPADNYSGALVQIYAGGANQFTPIPGTLGTNDWQLIEKTFTTPVTPNATWYVRLRLWNASGTAWFDNVTLQEVQ
ncbi:MAG: carbohydrate binding domain-containing protein [Victivallaceae bacterium]